MFASHSHAKEFQIKFQLTNLSRGDKPIIEYFSHVRHLVDALTTTSNPLSDKDLVTYLLNGLGPLYESFVTSITTQAEPVSSQELYHLLLIHESRITHTNLNNSSFSFQTSANASTRQICDQRGRNFNRGNRTGHGRRDNSRGNGRGFSSNTYQTPSTYSPNSRSSPPPTNTNQRPTCQICSKQGHIALQCYSRFDHAYQHEPPSFFLSQLHYSLKQSRLHLVPRLSNHSSHH